MAKRVKEEGGGAPRRLETYKVSTDRATVTRTVSTKNGLRRSSLRIAAGASLHHDAHALFDLSWLGLRKRPTTRRPSKVVKIVDLFSGCGQMSVGVAEAARALGMRAELSLALDLDPNAVEVCKRTFPECCGVADRLENHIDGELGARSTAAEREFVKKVREVDILVGGPPCQGHSDLNNHTRRNDARNSLALRVARFAEITRPSHVVIENVRGIVHDRSGVLARTDEHLRTLGYRTAQRLLRAEDYGVAQRRRRMFFVATLNSDVDLGGVLEPPLTRTRDFGWACSTVVTDPQTDPLAVAPKPSATNLRRIQHLFAHDLWELPDSERPACHRSQVHSYKSIYGRLHWDQPAQTITTGFRSMGQGRYVHPTQPRTITPREAARLQFIPDFVDFSDLNATTVAKLIGNAVPPKLTYSLALDLLRATPGKL